MATNYRKAGNRIKVTLADDAVSGVPMAAGSMAAVPINSGVTGDTISAALGGVWTFTTALASQATGTVVDWDVSGAAVVASGGGDFELGKVFDQPDSGEINVMVNGLPSPYQVP